MRSQCTIVPPSKTLEINYQNPVIRETEAADFFWPREGAAGRLSWPGALFFGSPSALRECGHQAIGAEEVTGVAVDHHWTETGEEVHYRLYAQADSRINPSKISE